VSRNLCQLAFAAGLAAAGVAVSDGNAASNAWKDPAQVRLIDGGMLEDGATRLAGLEVLLDPGWKTYWRNPGDSGIPPQIDFAGSENVADVAIEWPAPELSWDGYAWVIGYTEAVVFPLRVTMRDPATPAELKLRLTYGVCKDICIPAEADAEIVLDGSSARPSAIEMYRDRVPSLIDAAGENGGVVSAAVNRDGDVPILELHVSLPGAPEDGFAVVEGPPGWYLPVPERTGADAAGATVYTVPLDGATDPDDLSGAELRVTGISPAFSFEQLVTLD